MFTAAGLGALATVPLPEGGSLLERVSHISSVSGGSLAAAYYAVKKPARDTPVLLQERTVRRALILSFNSGYPFSVGYRLLGVRKEPWTLWSYDFSRIPSIMEERATAYYSLFYRSMQAQGVFPDDQTLHIVFLRHTDAQWADDLSDLPEACRHERPALTSAQAVRERIAEIPTRFVVASACDRQLLDTAAAKVVAQRQQEIQDFLAGRPTSEDSAH